MSEGANTDCPQCGATHYFEGHVRDRDLVCEECQAVFRVHREKRRHRRPRTKWAPTAGGPGAAEYSAKSKNFTVVLISVLVIIGVVLLLILAIEYLPGLFGKVKPVGS